MVLDSLDNQAKAVVAGVGALGLAAALFVYSTDRYSKNDINRPVTHYSVPVNETAQLKGNVTANDLVDAQIHRRYDLEKVFNKEEFLDYVSGQNKAAAEAEEFARSSPVSGFSGVDRFPGMEKMPRWVVMTDKRELDLDRDGTPEYFYSYRLSSGQEGEEIMGSGGKAVFSSNKRSDIYVSPEMSGGMQNIFAKTQTAEGFSRVGEYRWNGNMYVLEGFFVLPEDMKTNAENLRAKLQSTRNQYEQAAVWGNFGELFGKVYAVRAYESLMGAENDEDVVWTSLAMMKQTGVDPIHYKNPELFFNVLFNRVPILFQPGQNLERIVDRKNVYRSADEIISYYQSTTDPQMITNYMNQLQEQIGSTNALHALAIAQTRPEFRYLIPDDEVEFDKLARVIADKKNLPQGSLTPELIRRLYSDEVRSFAAGDWRLTAFGVAVDAVRDVTGQTKVHEMIDANIKANTVLGNNAAAYQKQYLGQDPPASELLLMQRFGSSYTVPEGPRAPSNPQYVTGVQRGEFSTTTTYSNQPPANPLAGLSNMQPGPKGPEAAARAAQDVNRGVQGAGRAMQQGIQDLQKMLPPPKKGGS